ncbi:hypothetical protein [Bacteroides sp.]|uniref:hypothetical protein n=1 Tax=Bacteroides sp. TaxID=29523 RepID=UPI0026035F99|nr:hypothetical protein [Bacteroides sp.]MDD3039785.1 hypothetical protein [Bacteroides sp.]
MISIVISSCDDGRIYEKTVHIPREGRTLKLTGKINGIDKWTNDYNIVVAGFDDKSEYAIISKIVSTSVGEDDNTQVIMAGISDDVTKVELCAIDRLRRRVVTFCSINSSTAEADTIRMDAGTIDVSMYHAIQTHIFTTSCIGCHGESTEAAAQLHLTEGVSYSALVNQPSTINGNILRVKTNNTQESLLHLILNSNDYTHHPHTDILPAKTKTELLELIDSWIDDGAQQ